MAIWQYNLLLLPEEEVTSFFDTDSSLRVDDINEINWWKYRKLQVENLPAIGSFLPENKSWSEKMLLFGQENSDCIECIIENNQVVELSARIDLRNNYDLLLKKICDLGVSMNCLFINDSYKILSPNFAVINQDIHEQNKYETFLKSLK